MEEEKARYCKECGKELKKLHLTAYSKYLCPDCETSLSTDALLEKALSCR
jgi:predicted RNA-binding Zn-ribbon protein involved in translation (DUF1610 family)